MLTLCFLWILGSKINKAKYSVCVFTVFHLCVGNGNTTQWNRQVSGHTFFLPPNSPLIMMSPHCTTPSYVTLEKPSFFIMQSRHLSIFPEDPWKQSPESSVSWEWAHSWALREHPGLGGGNGLKWKLKFTSVEHVLISICLSLMTHPSLQTRVYYAFCTYGAQIHSIHLIFYPVILVCFC